MASARSAAVGRIVSETLVDRYPGSDRSALMALAALTKASLWVASLAMLCLGSAQAAVTDISQVPLSTYSSQSTSVVKPNIFFILDDSGSMAWDYLPDWAGAAPTNYKSLPDYLYRNNGYNGVAYNPAIRYTPPVGVTSSGALNTSQFPSLSTSTGWTAVKNDAYGVQDTKSTNLVNNAVFYTLIPGEYCTSSDLRVCITSSAASGIYTYPAPIRWCNSTALTNCKASYDSDTGYTYARTASPRTATLTISGNSNTSVSGITVGGVQILSATIAATTSASSLANSIVTNINNCSNAQTGNCATVGYVAYASGSTVTILAPGVTTSTPVVTLASGSMTITATAFAQATSPLSQYGTPVAAAVPGENIRTSITSTITSYPYPGSTTKAATRTDCAGQVCTYAEEMTNYANWWTYYRTRMQMIKSSASLAFANLDTAANLAAGVSNFRVGYMSINNNAGSQFVNVSDFSGTQKYNWYTALFKAIPGGGTPTRQALADAGRMYGGTLTSRNGVTVTDPLQYSCQRNFSILSTDGYWNSGSGYKLDGATMVGNQDGAYSGAYGDGGSSTLQQQTSTLQTRTSTQTAKIGTLQSQTFTLQKQTATLQQSTALLYQGTKSGPNWNWGSTPVSSCTFSGTTSCRYAGQSSAGVGTITYGTPTTVTSGSCTPVAAGTNTGNNQVWKTAVSCGYSNWSTATSVSSCTPVAQSSGTGNWTVLTATQCSYSAGATVAASSCTPVAQSSGTGTWTVATATSCSYAFGSTAVPTATCSPAYVAGNYANATVYGSCTTTAGTWVNAGASGCTATTTPNASGQTTQCQYSSWSSWSNASSCTSVPQSTGPVYTTLTATNCQTVASGGTSDTMSDVAAYYYYTDLRTTTPATSADTTGTCTGPVIAPNTTANNLCTDNVPSSGLDTNPKQHMNFYGLVLGAQGKMIYSVYQNDSSGNRVYVPNYWDQKSGDFYSVNAGSAPNSATGVCSWMSSGKCTWPIPGLGSGNGSNANIDDTWHAAVNGRGQYFLAGDPGALSTAFSTALTQIALIPRPGTAAASASSNPNVSTNNNYILNSSFQSVTWFGDLTLQLLNPDGTLSPQQWSAMQQLDCATTPWQANFTWAAGQVFNDGGQCYLVGTSYTSAATFNALNIDSLNTGVIAGAPVTRTIYTANTTKTALIPFAWGSLSTAQQAYFTEPAIAYNATAGTGLSQFCSTGTTGGCLTSAKQTNNTISPNGGRAGEALVKYLAGDRTYEGVDFRARTHVLGDIVSSEARYVQTPSFSYSDAGYAGFQSLMSSRAAAVYVAANDGMLHAFNATNGQENWAYIPSAVLPNLYQLADLNYGQTHRFMTDATSEVGDICPTAPAATCSGSQWKTILVAGLNAGGKGYYALDITNPTSPVLLWEFNDSTLGYTYGNPRITKLQNGTWVVILSSGDNNSDGVGRIYVLNAATGAPITAINGNGIISTATGSAASPSGLSRMAVDVLYPLTDNTAQAVYAGDLLGNLWRFDVNNTIGGTGYDAQRLVSFIGSDGQAQPITDKPSVARINGTPVVFVGTGRYLGVSDIANTNAESFYAVKDSYGSTSLLNPRATASGFVQQTLTATTCPTGSSTSLCSPGQLVYTSSNNTVNWTTNNGWFIDFPNSGERSFTDPSLGLGTLAFTTVKPIVTTSDPCGSGAVNNAQSYLYYLNYLTGAAVTGANSVIGISLGAGLATRPVLVKMADGSVRALIRQASGALGSGTDMGFTNNFTAPITPSIAGTVRRVSWRELNGM